MSEELISEYVDEAAIKTQTDFLIGEIERAKIAYSNLSNTKVNIQGATGLSGISAGSQQAEKDTLKLIAAQQKLVEVQTKIAQQRLDASKTSQGNAAAKQEAKNAADLSNDYKQLSLAYNDAALKAKNYAINLGLTNPLTKQAISDANAMGNQLKILDASVGQYQRSVGDYGNKLGVLSKAFKGLGGLGIILSRAFGVDPAVAQSLREVGLALRDLRHIKEVDKLATDGQTASQEANIVVTEEQKAAQIANATTMGTATGTTETYTIATEAQVAAQLELAAATNVATGAQKALRAILIASGIIVAVAAIGLLIYGLSQMVSSFSQVSKETKAYNEILEASAKGYGDQVAKIDILKVKLNDLNISTTDRIKYAKQYNEVADDGNHIDTTQINNLDLVNSKIGQQIELLKKRAIAKAAENIIAEKAEALITSQIKLQEVQDANPSVSDAALNKTTADAQKRLDEAHAKIGGFKLSAEEALSFVDLAPDQLQKAVQGNSRLAALQDQELVKFLQGVAARRKLITDAQTGQRSGTGAGLINIAKKNVADAQEDLDTYLKIGASLIDTQGFSTDSKGGAGDKQIADLTKRLTTEFDQYKIQEQRKQVILQAGVDNEKNSYDARISLANQFVSSQIALNRKQEAEDIRVKTEEAARETANLTKDLKGKNPEQQKRINENIATVAKNLQDQLSLIQVKAQDDRIGLATVYEKKFDDLTKEAEVKRAAKVKEQDDKALTDAKATRDKRQVVIEGEYSDNVQALNQSYVDGKISTENYNKQRKKLDEDYHKDSLTAEINYTKDVIKLMQLRGVDVSKELEQLAQLQKEISDGTKKDVDTAKQKTIEFLDQVQGYYSQVASVISSALDAAANARKSQLQGEIDAIDKKKDADLAANDVLVQSEQDKANNITRINAKAQIEKDQIDKKQKQIDRKNAQAQKALAIFQITLETAKAVAKDIGSPWKILFDIALGAAQIAIVASTPLPQFFKGKDKSNRYHGFATVNEIRNEVIERGDGSVEFPKGRNVVTYVGRDDVIYPSEDDWHDSISNAAHRDTNKNFAPVAENKDSVISGKLDQLIKYSKLSADKPVQIINGTDRGMVQLMNWGSKQTSYIQDNTNW